MFALGLAVSLGIGLACGAINGALVVGLGVHPFIITLGTMWIVRGIAFVSSNAESILLPRALTNVAKASLGLSDALYPVPMLVMIVVAVVGSIYLMHTVGGRHVFAVGGNAEASRFSGVPIGRVKIAVFVLSGLTAGLAAFMGASFYGSASCADATGYELYVIASAVVGGASLSGGKGSAVSALLGAVLIVLIRQSIRTLHFDQNYEWIIIGCAIIIAVVLDQASARFSVRRTAAGGKQPPDIVTYMRSHAHDRLASNSAVRMPLTVAAACSLFAAACGGSQPAPANQTAASPRAEDRDDRQELDQSRVPLGADRRGSGRQGTDRQAQRAGGDRLADAADRGRTGAGAAHRAGRQRGRERHPDLVLGCRQGDGRHQRRGRARRAGHDVRQRRARSRSASPSTASTTSRPARR